MFVSFRQLFSFAMLASFPFVAVPTMNAALITDPAGDFLKSYTGPQNGDLDVVSAQVFFDGSNFTFTSTQAAPVGLTPGAIYVWGIDRGAGRQGFPAIAPGVLFDSIVLLNPTGASSARDLISNTSTTVTNITISGSTITATVPYSALLPKGLNPSQYTVNLWPRLSTITGDPAISDFAPDNSNQLVTSITPEPSTISLLGLAGCGLIGLSRLRRKAHTA